MAGRRVRYASLGIAVAACLLHGAAPCTALADGGTIRASARRGDRMISVFTGPTPLRAGPADVSVFVQDADTGAPLPDTSIDVHAFPLSHPENGSRAPATRQAATNKLLQAAALTFSETGRWHVIVGLSGARAERPIEFDVEVAEPLPRWLDLAPWIAWPLLPIGLFAVHQLLDDRRRHSSKLRSTGGPDPRSSP